MPTRRWFPYLLVGCLTALASLMLWPSLIKAAPPAGHKPKTWIPWEAVVEPSIQVVRSHQVPVPGTNVGDLFSAHCKFEEGTFRPGYWEGSPLPALRPWVWMPIKTGNSQADKAATATATYLGQKLWVSASGEYLIPPEPVNSAGAATIRVPTRKDLRIELDLGVKIIQMDNDTDGLWDDWEIQYAYAVKQGEPDNTTSPLFNPLHVFTASADWDEDGLTNLEEMQIGSSPINKDSDSDTVSDKVEVDASLNPMDGDDLGRDSDGDGLSDGVERLIRWAANKRLIAGFWSLEVTALANLDASSSVDTDNDGLSDDWEIVWRRNPMVADPRDKDQDGDGLIDLLESRYRTWPCLPLASLLPPFVSFCDFNNDGVTDILQPEFKFAPAGFSNYRSFHSGNGTWDEVPPDSPSMFFPPQPQNTDGDNMNDLPEIIIGRNPLVPDDGSMVVDPYHAYNNPGVATGDDSDGDGVSDALELFIFPSSESWHITDYADLARDTDGDKISDGVETLLSYAVRRLIPGSTMSSPLPSESLAELDGYKAPEQWYRDCWLMSKDIAMDSDGDGFSDSWEIVWGTDPHGPPATEEVPETYHPRASEDFDEDGLSNIDEYNLRTYPAQVSSRLSEGWSANSGSLFCDFNGNGVNDIFEPAFGLMVQGFRYLGGGSTTGLNNQPITAGPASFIFGNPQNTDGDSLGDSEETDMQLHPGRNPRVRDEPSHLQQGFSFGEIYAGLGGNDRNWYNAQAWPVIRDAALSGHPPQFEGMFTNQDVDSDVPRYYTVLKTGDRSGHPLGPSDTPIPISSWAWSFRFTFSDWSNMIDIPELYIYEPTVMLFDNTSSDFGEQTSMEVAGVGDVMKRTMVKTSRIDDFVVDFPSLIDYAKTRTRMSSLIVTDSWSTSFRALPPGAMPSSPLQDYKMWEGAVSTGKPYTTTTMFHAVSEASEELKELALWPVSTATRKHIYTRANQIKGFESEIGDEGKHFWFLGVSGAPKYKFDFPSSLKVFAFSILSQTDVPIRAGRIYDAADIPNVFGYNLRVEMAQGAYLGTHSISVTGVYNYLAQSSTQFFPVYGHHEFYDTQEFLGTPLKLRASDPTKAPGYRLQLSEDGGSRYRKIGLNGVPLGDEKPQASTWESNLEDATSIDALSLTLSHRASDLYLPIANSELSISVARSLHQEKVDDRMKTLPFVRNGLQGDYSGKPFGLCWNASLTPHAVLQVDAADNTREPDMMTVTDEAGVPYRFAIIWSPATTANPVKVPGFLPMPSVTDQTSMLNRLAVKPGSNYNVQNPATWELELTKRSGTVTRFVALGSVTDNDPEEGGSMGQPVWRRYYFRCKPAVAPFYADWAVQDRFGNKLYYEYSTTPGPPIGTTAISAALIPAGISDSPQRGRRLVIQKCGADSGLPVPGRFVSSVEIREKDSTGAEVSLQKVFYHYELRNLKTDFHWEAGLAQSFGPQSVEGVFLVSMERQAGMTTTGPGNAANLLTRYRYDSILDEEISWELQGNTGDPNKTHACVWLDRIADREGGYYEFQTEFDRSRQKYSCGNPEGGIDPIYLVQGQYENIFGLDRPITKVLQKGPHEAVPHLLSEMRLQFDGRGDLGPVKIESKLGSGGSAAVTGERVNAVVDADRRIRYYRFSAPVIRDTEGFRNLFFPPGFDETGMPEYRDRIGLLTWRKMELDHGLGAKETYEFEPEAMMALKSATMELPGGQAPVTTTWKYESVFKPDDFIPVLKDRTDLAGRPLAQHPFFCRFYPEPSEERRVLSGSNALSTPGNGSVIQKRFRYWGDDHAGIFGASLKPWARSMVKSSLLVNNNLQTWTQTDLHPDNGLPIKETVMGPDGMSNEWVMLQDTRFYYGTIPADPWVQYPQNPPLAFGTKAYLWRKDIVRGISDTQPLRTVYVPDRFNNVAKTITGNANTGTVEYAQYNALGQIMAKADGRAGVGLGTIQVPDLMASVFATKFSYRLDGRLLQSVAPAVETEAAFPDGETGPAATTYHYDNLGRKEKVVEADGSETRYAYDDYGRVKSTGRYFTDGSPAQTATTEYSPSGLVASTLAPNGLVTEYQYDWLRRVVLQRSIDAGGPVPSVETRMEYVGANCGSSLFSSSGFQPTKITGPFVFDNGQPAIKTAVYDSLNRKISEAIEFNPGQYATNQWGYNARGNTVVAKDPDGLETTSVYDGLGRATRVTKPDTSYSSTVYSGAGLPLSVTQWIPGISDGVTSYPARTRTTRTSYDIAGRAFEVFLPNPASLSGGTTGTAASRTFYNPAGQVREVQTAKHGGGYAVTTTSYDRRGRVVKVEQPAVLDYGASALGSLTTTPIAARPTTTTAYDRMNRATRVINPRNDSSLTIYNQAGQAVRTVSAVLPVSTVAGSAVAGVDRRLVSITQVDIAGNPLRVSTGQSIAASNDEAAYLAAKGLGMPDLETNLERGAVRNVYDRRGRLLASTRASSTTPYQTVTESFTYDAIGNRTAIVDGRGQRSTLTYDALGRILTTVHGAGQADDTTTNYYSATKLLRTVDANGRTTYLYYDKAYRVERISYMVPQDGQTAGPSDQEQRMKTNAAGELLRVSFTGAPHRDTAYKYDARGRRTHETSSGLTHAYFYDEPGNLTQVIHGGTGRTLTSTYDALNRLLTCTETPDATAATAAAGRVTRYHYDLAGNIRRKALPNGSAEDKAFDAAGRAITQGVYMVADSPEVPRSSLASYWDALGNLVWQLDQRPAAGGLDAVSRRTVNFYDGLSRLTEEVIYPGVAPTAPAADPPESVTSYTYDEANNRTSITRQATAVHEVELYDYTSTVVTTHLTDAGPAGETQGYAPNQLRQITVNGVVRAAFRYDRNGNRTRKWEAAGSVTTTYEWDRGNRLVQATRSPAAGNTQTWQWTYDHRSRRILRDAPGPGQEQDSYAGGTSANRWNIGDAPPAAAPAANQLAVEYVRGSDYGGGVGGVLYTIDPPVPGSPAGTAGTPVSILPIIASGSSSFPGFADSYANDANPLSDWASFTQGEGSFLDLDLGATYVLTTALVTDRVTSGGGQDSFAGGLSDFTTSFSLTTYSDAAFTTATGTLTFSKGLPSSSSQVSDFLATVPTSGLTGRYVRYQVLATQGANPGLSDIRFEGIEDEGSPTGTAGAPGTARFFEYGARGDVTGQSDATGTATFRAVYKAFGDYQSSGDSGPSRQRASTKDEESELGLLNEGFRYREVSTGAFLSRDPAGFVDGPNLYAYVQQNPWSAFDPNGLATAACAGCHGTADGSWLNIAAYGLNGFDSRNSNHQWQAMGLNTGLRGEFADAKEAVVRANGAVKTTAGALAVTAGASATSTGVGSPLGGPAVVGGAFLYRQGLEELATGSPAPGMKERAISAGVDPDAAAMLSGLSDVSMALQVGSSSAKLTKTKTEALTKFLSSSPAEKSGPKLFKNLLDQQQTVNAGQLLFKDGKWRVQMSGGQSRTATGNMNFVRLPDGRILAHPSAGHTGISHGRDVAYAGQAQFTKSGQLKQWDNGSGHYRPAADHADQAGLPMDKFKAHPELKSAQD